MDFSAQQVCGSRGNAALQLITCGGAFDSQTGGYESNVVVHPSLVSTTPAPPDRGETADPLPHAGSVPSLLHLTRRYLQV